MFHHFPIELVDKPTSWRCHFFYYDGDSLVKTKEKFDIPLEKTSKKQITTMETSLNAAVKAKDPKKAWQAKLAKEGRTVVGMDLPEGVEVHIPPGLARFTGFGTVFKAYEGGNRTIWILSDIVKNMIVNGNTLPLLTPTPIEFVTQSKFIHEYVPVQLDRFSRIHIQCVTNLETLEPLIDTFQVYITLHFKPYKQIMNTDDSHQDER